MIRKVTDPKKVCTDKVVLKELQRQNIDKDYVEFFDDYKAHPYTKRYRDKKSKKIIAVISGLPMRRKTDGVKIDIRWKQVGDTFENMPNLFDAAVDGTQIVVTVLNDQPSGTKAGDSMTYQPQLFIDDKEIFPTSNIPELLEIDPTNPDLHQNVLEWDYGVCKRYLRIVQGRIRGFWVFNENPSGDVRIKYNRSGKLKLQLGNASDSANGIIAVSMKNVDEETITAEEFSKGIYPVTIGDSSSTFYPDAHVESTSVDGRVSHSETNYLSWDDLRGKAGNGADDNSNNMLVYIRTDYDSNKWAQLRRLIMLFDTSALIGLGIYVADIISATLSLWGISKTDGLSISPDLNIYASTPASDTALEASDFVDIGTTPFCDTAITYAGFTSGGYNDFVLNASGILAIIVNGVSKFGARNANYDVSGNDPSWSQEQTSYFNIQAADNGSNKPKLVVTYPTPVVIPTVTTQAVTNIAETTATGNGNITDTGGENCDKRGVCWNTTGNPTVADSKAEEVGSFGTGAFTRSMTGLSPGVKYYVKAYAHNSEGYGYGSQVEFTAKMTITPSSQSITTSLKVATVAIFCTVAAAVQPLALTQNESTLQISPPAFEPETQAVTLTQKAPSITASFTDEPVSQSITLTQNTPTVDVSYTGTPVVQTLALTQKETSLQISPVLKPETQAVTLTQKAPSVQGSTTIDPTVQTLAIIQKTPVIGISYTASPSLQTISLAQKAPSLQMSQVLKPAVQSLAFTQYAPDLSPDMIIYPPAQTLALEQLDATNWHGERIYPAVQSMSLTQHEANAVAGVLFDALKQELSFILKQPILPARGNVSVLFLGKRPGITFVSTLPTSYTETPALQTLGIAIKTPEFVGQTGVLILPETQSISITQNDIQLLMSSVLEPEAQSISITLNTPVVEVAYPVDVQSLTLTQYQVVVQDTILADVQSISLTVNTPSIGLDVTPDCQTLSLTQYSPEVVIGQIITPDVQTISITQKDATVIAGYSYNADKQTISLTVNGVSLVISQKIEPSCQSITLTQHGPSVYTGYLNEPAVQSMTLTQNSPVVDIDYTHSAGTQSMTLTQYAPSVYTGYLDEPSVQSMTLTQKGVSLLISPTLKPGVQSISITLNSPIIIVDYTHSSGTQSMTLTQKGGSLVISPILKPSAQNLTVTQFAPTIQIT